MSNERIPPYFPTDAKFIPLRIGSVTVAVFCICFGLLWGCNAPQSIAQDKTDQEKSVPNKAEPEKAASENKTPEKQAKGPPQGPPPAFVSIVPIEEREVSLGQSFVGTLEPRRRSIVGSAVDGRVSDVLVDEGYWVEQGAPMVRLLTETTKIELAHAQAELLHSQEMLKELENGSRLEEKAEAKAKWDGSKALLDYARARHERAMALKTRGGSLSQDEVDQAYSAFLAAEQTQVAAKAMFEMMEKGPRQERIAQAKAQVVAQQELVRQLEDRLEKFTIKAPFAGYVVNKFTETGAWIKRGDSIMEVVEIDPMEVTVAVPENAVSALQEALHQSEKSGEIAGAIVKIDALQNTPFPAEIEKIVPQADLRTRTFPVKLKVANPRAGKQHTLMAGMICHAVLPIGKKQTALLVPKDALVLGGPVPMVYVAETDAEKQLKAKGVPVQIGSAHGSWLQITGDVTAGMSVITRGNERVFPGQSLLVIENKSE
jgi:HlyD family secretion protein